MVLLMFLGSRVMTLFVSMKFQNLSLQPTCAIRYGCLVRLDKRTAQNKMGARIQTLKSVIPIMCAGKFHPLHLFASAHHSLSITLALGIAMDYLDDLDQASLNALNELNGNDDGDTLCLAPHLGQTLVHTAIKATPKQTRSRRNAPTYLLKVEGPLTSPQEFASAIGLTALPPVERGESEQDTAYFYRLDESNMQKLEAWLAAKFPSHRPTKIRLNIAYKDDFAIPTLGMDPALLQHRPDYAQLPKTAMVQEYPVCYFFYGTLADPERLEHLFEPPSSAPWPILRKATVQDGAIRIWGGKYRALINQPGGNVVGWACVVEMRE